MGLARARSRTRRSRCGVEALLQSDDKLIEVFRLARELGGALALRGERLLGFGLALLALLDQQREPLALGRQYE